MKHTITSILNDITEKIQNDIGISPDEWIDSAQKLNVLTSLIDNHIDRMEALMAEREQDIIAKDSKISVARVKVLKRLAIREYKIKGLDKKGEELYNHLQLLKTRIENHIRLARDKAKSGFTNI